MIVSTSEEDEAFLIKTQVLCIEPGTNADALLRRHHATQTLMPLHEIFLMTNLRRLCLF